MASQLDFAGGTFVDGLVAEADDTLQVADSAAVETHRRLVIAFVGLAFEAKIAAAPGVQVVCRTAGSELEAIADSAVRQGYRGMISFGVAGGLASQLRAGDWIVASSIREEHTVRQTDAVWSRKLLGMIDGAIHAPIVGVDSPIAEPAKKRELYRATGAAAVDMESHVVARVAAKHKLAFAALRVVVDPAHRAVPPAALIDMRPDGRPNVSAMLREVMTRPSQLSPLARIAVDAFTARAAMNRVRRDLGPHFGLMDQG
ncbi:MAG: adenosylhopane nucleosidase [Xanthobacteraceae bacterium]|jgi:adenosylhomocysteine nucleosidase